MILWLGQLKNENVAVTLNVLDKIKGKPYMGVSVELDTVPTPG